MPSILRDLDTAARPSDLLDLPDDAFVGISHEMSPEEFDAYDAWVSEQEEAAGMDETEQAEFEKVWRSL